jgi:hypothetical protein
MNPRRIALLAPLAASLVALALLPSAATAFGSGSLFSPRVPVSAFAIPHWFDPSRLHVSTMVSMGTSGWGAPGTNAMQVTTLSYSFRAPVAMSVSVGNAWGPNSAPGSQSFFLEGFRLAYQPSRSFMLQVQYQDLRSPLQLQEYGLRGSRPWGY